MRSLIATLVLCLHVMPGYAAERIVLPLHFENNIPVVTLRVAGRDLQFMLDTGASSAFYLDHDTELAIPGASRTGKVRKSFDLAGVVAENYEIAVDDLAVDGMHFHCLLGRTFKPWGPGHEGPAAPPQISVLGLSFFDNKRILFDFPEKQLIIWDADGEQPSQVANWQSIPFERAGEGLIVAFTGGQHLYRLMLDSASTTSILKRDSVKIGDLGQSCNPQLDQKALCSQLSVSLDGRQPITLNFTDLPPDFNADGMVGREFFDKYQVYVDNKARVMRVKATADH